MKNKFKRKDKDDKTKLTILRTEMNTYIYTHTKLTQRHPTTSLYTILESTKHKDYNGITIYFSKNFPPKYDNRNFLWKKDAKWTEIYLSKTSWTSDTAPPDFTFMLN